MEAFVCPEHYVLRLGFNLLTAVTMAMETGSKVGSGNRATVVFFVTILVVSVVFAVYAVLPAHKAQLGGSAASATAQGLSSFQSYSQLQAFVAANAKSAQEYDRYGGAGFIGGPVMFAGGVNGGLVAGIAGIAPGAEAAVAAGSQSSPAFTGTNVQVQGVDEPDIVKTDGTHLFVAANGPAPAPRKRLRHDNPGLPAELRRGPLHGEPLRAPRSIGIEVAQDRLMVIDQGYTKHDLHRPLPLQHLRPLLAEPHQNVTVAGSLRGRPHGPRIPLRGSAAALLPVQQPGERDGRDALRDRERRQSCPSAVLGATTPRTTRRSATTR